MSDNGTLQEHKLFLKVLLAEERAQRRLRKAYDNCSPTQKKKKKNLQSKLARRKAGRQRVSFDYAVAKTIVQSEGIASVSQYKSWHKMNNPQRMPKYPARAYKSEWTGWGDFLGIHNKPIVEWKAGESNCRKYRSFEDARSFARSLSLSTVQEWYAYARSGHLPSDIPYRPDIVYSRNKRNKSWLSWKDFLGYAVQTTADKIQQVSPVLYIARKYGAVHRNVYIINVIPGGRAALIDHLMKMRVELIGAYYTSAIFDHLAVIRRLCKYRRGEIDEFIINNVFSLLEVFDDNLVRVEGMLRR